MTFNFSLYYAMAMANFQPFNWLYGTNYRMLSPVTVYLVISQYSIPILRFVVCAHMPYYYKPSHIFEIVL